MYYLWKRPFFAPPQWNIINTVLQNAQNFDYLGAVLGNISCNAHILGNISCNAHILGNISCNAHILGSISCNAHILGNISCNAHIQAM